MIRACSRPDSVPRSMLPSASANRTPALSNRGIAYSRSSGSRSPRSHFQTYTTSTSRASTMRITSSQPGRYSPGRVGPCGRSRRRYPTAGRPRSSRAPRPFLQVGELVDDAVLVAELVQADPDVDDAPDDRGGQVVDPHMCCYSLEESCCRHHHRNKQAPGWHVEGTGQPGYFAWTLPSGRTYPSTPTT